MSYIHVSKYVQKMGLKLKGKHQESSPSSQARSNPNIFYDKIKIKCQNNQKNKIKNIET